MTRVVVAWSGGKDAAYALYTLGERTDVEVRELLTTFNEAHDRSSMHGVRRQLYERQADSLSLPLNPVMLPPDPSNEAYEAVMDRELERYTDRDVDAVVFADLFLEEIRAYRERQLSGTGVDGCWPVWGRDTGELAASFLEAGFEATVVAVDADALDASYVGREFDEAFLDDLPRGVDPCGENGEFHTFVRNGPPFAEPVAVETGETVTRSVGETEIHYVDLRLADWRADGRE